MLAAPPILSPHPGQTGAVATAPRTRGALRADRGRAVQELGQPQVAARIVDATDLQARRMAAAKNMQREDLSAVEEVAGIVELVDAELGEEPDYLALGDGPVQRLKALLGRLDSVRASKERGSEVRPEAEALFHKCMEQLETIFTALPRPVEWPCYLPAR